MENVVTPEKIKNLLSSFLVKPQISKENEQEPCESRNTEKDSETTGATKTCNTNALRSFSSFIERLETFSALTWFGKASDLSPLVCARYGWENVDTDMLQCVGCKMFLSGHLPDKSDLPAYEESYNKLKKNLIASHDKFCVLAANPCPEHFCHVPVEDPAQLLSDFTQRIKDLMLIQDRIPCIELHTLHSLGYDEGQGGAYCKRHLMPDFDTTPQVFTLAVTGWTYSSSTKDVLHCSMCLRQIGIWNYLPSDHSDISNTDNNDEDDEPKLKKRKPAAAFDPLDEHNHWCPWIQKTSMPVLPMSSPNNDSRNSGPVPACIAALKVIAPGLMDNNTGLATAMKTSPMVEGLRCFRRVMKSWSSERALPTSTSN